MKIAPVTTPTIPVPWALLWTPEFKIEQTWITFPTLQQSTSHNSLNQHLPQHHIKGKSCFHDLSLVLQQHMEEPISNGVPHPSTLFTNMEQKKHIGVNEMIYHCSSWQYPMHGYSRQTTGRLGRGNEVTIAWACFKVSITLPSYTI